MLVHACFAVFAAVTHGKAALLYLPVFFAGVLQSERNVGVGEVLRVESVTQQDGGLYVCTADNGAGSQSRDFTIHVQCTFYYLQHGALVSGTYML